VKKRKTTDCVCAASAGSSSTYEEMKQKVVKDKALGEGVLNMSWGLCNEEKSVCFGRRSDAWFPFFLGCGHLGWWDSCGGAPTASVGGE